MKEILEYQKVIDFIIIAAVAVIFVCVIVIAFALIGNFLRKIQGRKNQLDTTRLARNNHDLIEND